MSDDGKQGGALLIAACLIAAIRLRGDKAERRFTIRCSLPSSTSYRHAVKQLPKSVVREIRSLRSVGAGGG